MTTAAAITPLTIEMKARFENGVFVPEGKVELEQHQRVTLRISPQPVPKDAADSDPRPEGGVELLEWRSRHLIQIDPDIAREIAENPEFDIENS